jgi:hypothetical protein
VNLGHRKQYGKGGQLKNATQIIQQYQLQHAGMSSYLDNQLGTIQQVLQDAGWREKEGELYWRGVNLEIAEKLTVSLLQMITPDGVVRETLVELYRTISDIPRAEG